jgi:hypothetical protein
VPRERGGSSLNSRSKFKVQYREGVGYSTAQHSTAHSSTMTAQHTGSDKNFDPFEMIDCFGGPAFDFPDGLALGFVFGFGFQFGFGLDYFNK